MSERERVPLGELLYSSRILKRIRSSGKEGKDIDMRQIIYDFDDLYNQRLALEAARSLFENEKIEFDGKGLRIVEKQVTSDVSGV